MSREFRKGIDAGLKELCIEPYYLDFAERYKKLCKGEIVWERNIKKR
jgi:hypothetical protein